MTDLNACLDAIDASRVPDASFSDEIRLDLSLAREATGRAAARASDPFVTHALALMHSGVDASTPTAVLADASRFAPPSMAVALGAELLRRDLLPARLDRLVGQCAAADADLATRLLSLAPDLPARVEALCAGLCWRVAAQRSVPDAWRDEIRSLDPYEVDERDAFAARLLLGFETAENAVAEVGSVGLGSALAVVLRSLPPSEEHSVRARLHHPVHLAGWLAAALQARGPSIQITRALGDAVDAVGGGALEAVHPSDARDAGWALVAATAWAGTPELASTVVEALALPSWQVALASARAVRVRGRSGECGDGERQTWWSVLTRSDDTTPMIPGVGPARLVPAIWWIRTEPSLELPDWTAHPPADRGR